MNQEICGFINDQKPLIFVNNARADPAARKRWTRRIHRFGGVAVVIMIELKNGTRRKHQHDNTVLALDNHSAQTEPAEFVAVTGESGSQKTTFLHLIGGLDKPDEGEVVVNGLALQTATDNEMTKYRANDLGIVFQFFNLLPALNVLEKVSVPLEFQGVKI